MWLAVAVPEAELVSRLGGIGYRMPVTIIGTGSLLFLGWFVALRACRPRTREKDPAGACVHRQQKGRVASADQMP